MASYVIIRQSPAAGASSDDIVALVVTDGSTVRVFPDEDPTGLSDYDWPTGDPDDVLRTGCANLYYFAVDGPHQFEGTTAESAEPLARTYGLA